MSTRRNSRWGLFIGMAWLRAPRKGGRTVAGTWSLAKLIVHAINAPPLHTHGIPNTRQAMASNTYRWPDGKRIAVAVTVMLETWSEGKAPPYGVQASPIKAGAVDLGGIAWGSYGAKVGVWRIIICHG